jgi:hypothetical protein
MLPPTPVFINGEQAPGLPRHLNFTYGFHIPSLVTTPEGHLLAFAEAYLKQAPAPTDSVQPAAAAPPTAPLDFGLRDGFDGWIDIVCKRSEDGGRTWGPLTVVSRNSSLLTGERHTWGQQTPIVDRERGKVLLLSSLDNMHVRLQTSEDDGRTWTPWHRARDLDHSLRRPGWGRHYMGLPVGIQLEHPSPRAGRLLACASAFMDGANASSRYSYAVHSDDHGESWRMSAPIGPRHTSECSVAQRRDGDGAAFIYARIWNASCDGCLGYGRGIAESRDGGDTWGLATLHGLPDDVPDVEGSFASAAVEREDGRRETCFFTSAPRPYNKTSTSPGPRHNVSVRYACGRRFDEREWSLLHMVDPNSSSYSSIVHHRHPRHRHGAALLDLWAYSEDYHKHPQACFWPPFPSNETGWDRYACKGGVRVAAVPLPSEL